MCWELRVLSHGAYTVRFQISDVPQEVKDNRGSYYVHSLGYEINSCSRPEIILDDRQIFVWGERREHDNDEIVLSKQAFLTVVRVLSGNAKVKIIGINKFCIGGC